MINVVTVYCADEIGFNVITKNKNFKCAFIKHSQQYSFGNVSEMKRHNATDEIFVLLKGSAVMLTMEENTFQETPMGVGKVYNITKGTWHYLALSEDAEAFVVENSDTDNTNSEVLKLSDCYVL